MSRGDLIERQWEILHLLGEQRRVSRRELAQRFDVDPKTIKRDFEVLTLDFPVEEERRGPEVTYSFHQGFRFPQVSFGSFETSELPGDATVTLL